MKATHAKYGGLAYSSAYGYSVPSGLYTLEQYALACQLGLSDDGGEFWKTRRLCKTSGIEDRNGGPVLVSTWAPFSDVEVKTLLVPPQEDTPNWHIRAHRIQAGRDVITADGSFAICNVKKANGRNLDPYDETTCEGTFPKLIGNYDQNTPEGWSTGKEGAFTVSKGAVGIRALESRASRAAQIVNADPNTNLMESRSVIPTLRDQIKKGETVWYVSAVYAKPSGPKEKFLDGWNNPPKIPSWLVSEMEN